MSTLSTLTNLGGSGPAVVLLHGYGSDRQSWLGTVPALFDHLSVWVMDLPAHGKSVQDCEDGSISTLSNSVLAAADAAGIHTFHLIGHSLGGRISLQLAGCEPDRILSLTTFSPAGLGVRINDEFLRRFATAEQTKEIHALLLSLVHDPQMITRALATSVLSYLNAPGIRESLQRISQGLLSAQQSLPETLTTIRTVDIERMTIWGANDSVNPIDDANAAALGGRLHVLDNCGHLPHIEHRVHVNKLLADFYEA